MYVSINSGTFIFSAITWSNTCQKLSSNQRVLFEIHQKQQLCVNFDVLSPSADFQTKPLVSNRLVKTSRI